MSERPDLAGDSSLVGIIALLGFVLVATAQVTNIILARGLAGSVRLVQPAQFMRTRPREEQSPGRSISHGSCLGSKSRKAPAEYLLSALPPKAATGRSLSMSASLIGRLGSSAFRLSTISASMSLAGSCFSSESAPRPFHHGIRRRGGTIFRAALPSDERQVQADMRTHLIHRPARDIIPPLGGARVSSYRI
jgi:hypothetical protein